MKTNLSVLISIMLIIFLLLTACANENNASDIPSDSSTTESELSSIEAPTNSPEESTSIPEETTAEPEILTTEAITEYKIPAINYELKRREDLVSGKIDVMHAFPAYPYYQRVAAGLLTDGNAHISTAEILQIISEYKCFNEAMRNIRLKQPFPDYTFGSGYGYDEYWGDYDDCIMFRKYDFRDVIYIYHYREDGIPIEAEKIEFEECHGCSLHNEDGSYKKNNDSQ